MTVERRKLTPIASQISGQPKAIAKRSSSAGWLGKLLILGGLVGALAFWQGYRNSHRLQVWLWQGENPPLAMKGGDPYIRALMRTISASESGGPSPYAVLYGGEHFADFSQHPDRCITIVTGPNTGSCTTAAGRYQFLTTTWQEKARFYHPNPSGLWFWQSYSFEPQYQDAVVYAWLSDRQAWGEDIPLLLKQGKLDQVLQLLSGTWTSLGYGIEDNFMTPSLGKIYKKILKEEKSQAQVLDSTQELAKKLQP
jgi:muramidase (phage lysozyme)